MPMHRPWPDAPATLPPKASLSSPRTVPTSVTNRKVVMSLTTRVRRGLAGTVVTALAAGALVALASPSQAAAGTVTDAALSWGLSNEQGAGAFNGSCNFLSAGTAGNTQGSRAWNQADNFYSTSEGNVRIEKPGLTGDVTPTWGTKCLDKNGLPVLAGSIESKTDNRVRFSSGTGSYTADGSGSISWTGSFTSAFYGGLTYWSAADPTLTVLPDGTGTLTATASGYGTDMDDTGQWDTLSPRSITLAEFTDADITDSGFIGTPRYREVSVTVPVGGVAQTTSGASWGSFPQSFVTFQGLTGQSSYWYSSGGSRDAAKPATRVTVTFGDTPVPPTETGPVVTPPVTPPVVAPLAPPVPTVAKAATAKPTVKVSKKPTSKKKGKATVTVKSANGVKPTGRATITLTRNKSKKVVTVTVRNGKATVNLPKLAKGTWKLKVTYAGSATQRASTSKTYTVTSAR